MNDRSTIERLFGALAALSTLSMMTACSPAMLPPRPDVVTMDATRPDVTAPCSAPQTMCATGCADTTTDIENCGGCGVRCNAGEACVAGSCSLSCPSGQMLCGRECATIISDPRHCGACGRTCPAGQLCSMGRCAVTCGAGLSACGGGGDAGVGVRVCVDTNSDSRHCGACGVACAAGQVCAMGRCVAACSAGQTECMGACVDTQRNAANCGACGNACPSGQVCTMGMCATSCPSGQLACMGACVNTAVDARNCGACGTACAAGQSCQMGMCREACATGQTACMGRCVDLQSDRTNCGLCGTTCPTGQTCQMGACAASCMTGQAACSGLCVDLSTDRRHCGRCATACALGQVCNMGVCAAACGAGQTECSGRCVNTRTDVANCGGCGNACPSGFACVSGGCFPLVGTDAGACLPPSLQCGPSCTDVRNDNANCGRCGNACTADRTCFSGMCLPTCSAGEIRCGAMGTCTDINRDSANCGMCGRACASGESCAGGTCSPDPSFRIATMSSMGCTLSADVQSAPMPAGDQRGLLVATNNLVYYTGDTSTVVLPASDLSTITAVGAVHDTLVADLRGSAAYIMLDAMGMSPSSGTSASIVALGQLTATGSLGAGRVMLSRALRLDSAGFNNGFYSGFGRIILYISGGADMGWWQIAMPTGLVTRLTGTMPPNGPVSCESWAHSGIAEFFGGEQYVVFMRGSTGVVRQRVRDGLQTTIMANTSTGDVCTVGFSIARNRWYFQYEAAPAWAPPPGGSFGEFVGTCTATWETP